MTNIKSQQRQNDLMKFLREAGFSGKNLKMIAGDASFRKYYRLCKDGKNYILMDAPPPEENVIPFIGIAQYLLDLGFSAPIVHHMNTKNGFLILEDLGDDSFNNIINQNQNFETTLYESAVDLLVEMHKACRTSSPAGPFSINKTETYSPTIYSRDTLMKEASLLTEWTMPALFPTETSRDTSYQEIFLSLIDSLDQENSVLCLRDFHADNLMWLNELKGLSRVGLLDFQDALIGHRAYDLVSLLQDARRDVPPELEEKMLQRFMMKSEIEDQQSFRRDYAILGAQRNAKIVGIFTRLYIRDKKPAYLSLIPRVWGLLERNFHLTELKPLQNWVDQYIPLKFRRDIISPEQLKDRSL